MARLGNAAKRRGNGEEEEMEEDRRENRERKRKKESRVTREGRARAQGWCPCRGHGGALVHRSVMSREGEGV